jgi:hypothetical protein
VVTRNGTGKKPGLFGTKKNAKMPPPPDVCKFTLDKDRLNCPFASSPDCSIFKNPAGPEAENVSFCRNVLYSSVVLK